MKKILFLLSAMVILFACNSEDYDNPQVAGLHVNADFIKLSDDSTTIAGKLIINANVPEVSIHWNTDSICNLDTTQTTLRLTKGKATLPIKWIGKQFNGSYGPERTAFKAGVKIVAGNYSQYVPLVWSQRIDSTKVLKSIQTRAMGDMMPRVAQITMTPSTVNMADGSGGAMFVGLSDIPYVILSYSEFNSSMNIDLNKLPTSLTASQMLSFEWTAAGAPNLDFSANVWALYEDLQVGGSVSYKVGGTGGIGGQLNYLSSNLPAGNIPKLGGTYTFDFEGTYTGNVQIRALVGGTVIATGTGVTNKKPSVTVPENNTLGTRNITFQYKRADSNWYDLPAATNRVQEDAGALNYVNSNLPAGNIPRNGGTYTFNFEGSYTGSVQVRALANGGVIATGLGSINKQPSVTVPQNTTLVTRNITFQYKREDDYWTSLPEATNRLQEDPGTLDYVNSNLPAGNIPRTGGTYTFTFEGTYPDAVQVRALGNGVVLATGTGVTTKRPSVTVPQNTAMAFRSITFQYKRADGDWTNLPAATNRTQGHPGEGIQLGGYTWAPGNLIRVGYVYQFQTNQSQYSANWAGGDYWNWNMLDPTYYQNANLSYSWDYTRDPCRQVAPAGTWRSPSNAEITALMNSGSRWGYSNGIGGRYFGPNNEVFLPAAGYRNKTTSVTGLGTIGFYWSSSQLTAGGNVYMLGFDSSGRINLDRSAHRANASQIRCVR